MMQSVAELQDNVELVARSLAGDREAFAGIVRRYQALMCAIAYNATGSITLSEDLAQEIFVTAWKRLSTLQEPTKLRQWLCGIGRNIIHSNLRANRNDRLTFSDAEVLGEQADSSEALPVDHAITKEEEELLWRSLERIPLMYREPLILFYREQQSIAHVAAALDLTEDAVKQRLSRGRKALHEQLLSFVENTLARSNPGKAFAVGVLVALPAMATSAKAAAVGATAAKGSAAAKGASMLAIVGAVLSPVMMFTGYWAGYRISMDAAASDSERSLIKGFYRRLIGCILAFFVVFATLCIFGPWMIARSSALFTGAVIAVLLLYSLATVGLMVWAGRRRRAIRRERATRPLVEEAPPMREYRGPIMLLGIPLIHMRLSSSPMQRPVFGWIAIGNCAQGILLAFGGSAMGLVAVGGGACGVVSFGGLSIGVISLGGFSIGAWAIGGLAVGWKALGGCAIAWRAAIGGVAIAHDAALGTLAQAHQVNNAVAEQMIVHGRFFRLGDFLNQHTVAMNALWLLPLLMWLRTAKKHSRKAPPANGPH